MGQVATRTHTCLNRETFSNYSIFKMISLSDSLNWTLYTAQPILVSICLLSGESGTRTHEPEGADLQSAAIAAMRSRHVYISIYLPRYSYYTTCYISCQILWEFIFSLSLWRLLYSTTLFSNCQICSRPRSGGVLELFDSSIIASILKKSNNLWKYLSKWGGCLLQPQSNHDSERALSDHLNVFRLPERSKGFRRFLCALRGIRTPDFLCRKQTLYPLNYEGRVEPVENTISTASTFCERVLDSQVLMTGLEPARLYRHNPLKVACLPNSTTWACFYSNVWSLQRESNSRPLSYQESALPLSYEGKSLSAGFDTRISPLLEAFLTLKL